MRDSEDSTPEDDDVSASASPDIPDLLSDNDNLREIMRVRDAVRSLRRDAKLLDAEAADLPDRNCDADICRSCLLICCRIIGGQRRNLNETDRACLEQVLGFPVACEALTKISIELRSKSPSELDSVFPELLRRKVDKDSRIHDPCDSIIRHFETIAGSTGQIYGDKRGKRANMAKRIGLQLRCLVDNERERVDNLPKDAPGEIQL